MAHLSHISRRTVLRGLGTALALPALEAMLPRASALAASGPAPEAPLRMAFCFVPNGMHMPDWQPKKTGRDFELTPILKPLEKHREQLLILGNVALRNGYALGDGPGDHARCTASFLTGAHPKKTDGPDIENGTSVDQIAAAQVGAATRFPSLELGCERSARAGRCDSGYSCVYTSNIAWRSPTQSAPKEVNPRTVFDRLFGNGNEGEQAANRTQRDALRKSILDFVQDDARQLEQQLGQSDRRKLDEYLHAVREIERRMEQAERLPAPELASTHSRPEGVPRAFDEHVKLMFDMLVLAFQTDSTRIATFMYSNAGSNRGYGNIGVSEGHHDLSHHGNNAEKQEKISKINQHHSAMFAYFLDRLSSISEGNGTLLDNCMIMYGSGLADGNAHAHHDLPILLAGKGGGTIATGRHLRYASEQPLTNLYLSLLDRMGAQATRIGDSTGRLPQLEG